ncbi:trihelix transcription factor GT-3b-like isoform X2 [Rhodamnia argentea]|uniref:Trihelix transcription factor GT-3b-like isoform X2 n=1 Tax=Rhodamnia argentea TaxID=178133 RepID=A0A8B8MW48_9MYRT|nr:trihelix transcription factor GT-3b-like isoform X2 [Rhodamnia argentea]
MFAGEDDDGESLGRIGMMASSLLSPAAPPQQPQPQPQPQQQQHQPQWSQEETREFIRIRAELERDFTAAKRNKNLWEIVSARMKEMGYRRTPEQCKCKWKNLLNRYKGKETSDPENGRKCPFFEELHAVFTERAKNMQRLHLESEGTSVQAKKRLKRYGGYQSSDELFEADDEDEDDSDEERPLKVGSRKRKAKKVVTNKQSGGTSRVSGGSSGADTLEMLKEFFKQQQVMEMQWRNMMERRAHERLLYEQEWRQSMEKLERERLMVEQAWREQEEQRRLREENRAERRDALLNTLLNKLLHETDL